MPMKQIELDSHKHTTMVEVKPAPKWVLPLALAIWLLIGWAAIGFDDWFPYVYGWCFGGVMLAAVASYPRFFLQEPRQR